MDLLKQYLPERYPSRWQPKDGPQRLCDARYLTPRGIAGLVLVAERITESRDPEEDPGYVELEVVSGDDHIGISATIYGPELRYRAGGRYEVQPARVNWSAIGATTPQVTLASAEALKIAAELAAAWTTESEPELERAARERTRQMQRDRAERQERYERTVAQVAELCERLEDETVRVTADGRKTALIGSITASDTSIVVKTRHATFKLQLAEVERIEVKRNGRFVETYCR